MGFGCPVLPEVQSTKAGASRAMREEGGGADCIVTADAAGSGEVRNGRSSEEPRTVVVPQPRSRFQNVRVALVWMACVQEHGNTFRGETGENGYTLFTPGAENPWVKLYENCL
jgi:hypothetical protein